MKRLTMRKIRDALRLHAGGMSTRKIAASLGVGQSTASEYVKRVQEAGLTWPLPSDMTDAALEALLFHPVGGPTRLVEARPDWPAIHRELRRKGVTLSLLWEEYRAVHPEGYGYSRFCELHRRWNGRLTPVMRQHHVAGERLFVDYAGATLEVVDPATGEVREAQLFVAALGASNLTYAEASWSQGLSDWVGAHSRAFAWFGGAPAQVVSDNLKSGVTRSCFYEPAVNRTCADMAEHYGTAVVPARPRKPRDKAKVEVAVQIAERWIVARLRDQRFFSLCELNTAIRGLLDRLNDRVTRHLGASRRDLFERIERAALRPLPAEPFVFSEWKRCTVGLDYHVEVDRHYYSAPHSLLREKVWVRFTARTVEIFHHGKRVAAHARTSANRQHTTIADHMPASHRRYSEWSPERLKTWAAKIGPNAATLVEVILRERSHPEQGFRSCLGIMRLARPHGPEALEAACERALLIGARSYSSVNSILKNNLHRNRPEPAADGPAIRHGNIRGPGYFH